MNDFTLAKYRKLLAALISAGYRFPTYYQFASGEMKFNAGEKFAILRHDIDARKRHALDFGRIQHELGIKGTYYFRNVPASYDETIIRELASMGHEIGYHYENMDTCNGNVDLAYRDFCKNLDLFRNLVDIKTICMHGSPVSPYDNRDIWQKYSYRDLGIIAEPYLDLDFNSVYYITDTGRRWNGANYSIRDKATVHNPCNNQVFLNLNYKGSNEIIASLDSETFPKNVMMTFHPQRWTDSTMLWWRELVMQNLKNQVKRLLVK